MDGEHSEQVAPVPSTACPGQVECTLHWCQSVSSTGWYIQLSVRHYNITHFSDTNKETAPYHLPSMPMSWAL